MVERLEAEGWFRDGESVGSNHGDATGKDGNGCIGGWCEGLHFSLEFIVSSPDNNVIEYYVLIFSSLLFFERAREDGRSRHLTSFRLFFGFSPRLFSTRHTTPHTFRSTK